MERLPPVISSRPAIIRSAVDLPQPDGPTSTMNSWSRMSRFNPSMTDTSPYRLATFLKTTPDIQALPPWARVGVPTGLLVEDCMDFIGLVPGCARTAARRGSPGADRPPVHPHRAGPPRPRHPRPRA